jgi:hypothetical protein
MALLISDWKPLRLHSTTNTIENGLVYLPEKASWLPEYLHELTTFPNGKRGFHIAGARLDQGRILGGRKYMVEGGSLEEVRIMDEKYGPPPEEPNPTPAFGPAVYTR